MPSLDVAINALRAKVGSQEFDTAVKRVQDSAAKTDQAIKTTDKSLFNLGNQIKNVAIGLVGLATVYKTVRFAQTAIKDAAAFEMELANVATMLDDQTMKYLPGYEKQIANLAVKYGQSTATLTKGLYDILSACIDANDAIGLLEIGVRAGTAGVTSAAVATNALITIINSYGYSAKEAGKISDILFALVKRGVLTFEELSSSIGNVIAIAASAELSLEQVAAAIATMTRAGIKADMAMTSLKGIITTFLTPTEESIVVAKRFGLELNATTLRTIGLTGVMEKLKYATIEETAEIFSNVRALLGAAATRKSVVALMKDYKAILESAGATEEAFGKIAATTEFQLSKNRELFKQIKRDIGEGIKPALDLWMAGFKPFVDEWKIGWQLMVHHMEESIELIRLRLIPTDANRNFVRQMLDADEAIRKFREGTDQLAQGLANLEKREVTITPLPIAEESAHTKKYTEEQKKAGLAITALFNELQKEREIIGLTNEERERAIKLAELEAHAKILLGDKSAEMVKLYKEELKELQKAYDLQEFYDKIEEGMAGIIRSPLTALLDETRGIEEVLKDELKNLAVSILESMYEEMITTPLKESMMKALKPIFEQATNMLSSLLSGVAGGIVSGIGSVIGMAIPGLFGFGATPTPAMIGMTGAGAKGLVLDRGSIVPFAKGDIFTRPTIFPMSNGGFGLAGEAGKEAIMPLARDAGGRLGVKAEGKTENKTPIKIINVMDQSAVQEYLSSGDGERQIVNIMRRNSRQIREIVS